MSVTLKSSVAWADWKEYLGWINKPRMMKLLDRRKKVSIAEHRKYTAGLKKKSSQKFFGAYESETQKFLGICALKNIEKRDKKAELYICLNDHRGKGNGFGKEVTRKLLDYGFIRLKLNRIYLYTPSFNHRAIRCYESVGFIEEGRLLEDLKIGSKYFDCVRMCYLKRFQKKRSRRKIIS